MKKLVTAIATVGLFITANAVVVDLGMTSGQPAGIENEATRLNGLIDLYNGVNEPDLPDVELGVSWEGTKTELSGDDTSYTLNLPGFTGYLLFKWGGNNRFYFVDDNLSPKNSIPTVNYSDGSIYTFYSDVPSPGGGKGGTQSYLGLSHYSQFVPVPEPTTAALGVGLLCLGLGLLKRWK